MKANIDRDGVLYITPETELEEYALKKWCEDHPTHHTREGSTMDSSKIIISTIKPQSCTEGCL